MHILPYPRGRRKARHWFTVNIFFVIEHKALQNKKPIPKTYCPRKEAVKELHKYITELQQQNYAIILVLDANQMARSCYIKNGVKQHTIKWLKISTCMSDPFTDMFGGHPPTTTINEE